jgi:hypothetical protein
LQDKEKKMIVYAAINSLTGQAYVGCSKYPLSIRRSCHECMSRKNPYYKFAKALREFGKEYFTWTVLEETNNKKDAWILEKKYIDELDTVEDGYNVKDSEEHKRKISRGNKKAWAKRRNKC